MRPSAVALLCTLLPAPCGWGPPAPPPAGDLWQAARIFQAVTSVLSSARGCVLVEMYEFGRPDLAAQLAAARARRAGVRVILDPTVPVTVATGRRLLASGVPVASTR